MEADQETLRRQRNELDEIIAMFAGIHAQTAELRRVLERTCRRAEGALALARKIRGLQAAVGVGRSSPSNQQRRAAK